MSTPTRKRTTPACDKRREFFALDLRVRERAVVFDGHILFGDDEKNDRQDDHDGGDDNAHLEKPAVDELDDIQIRLRSEKIIDANNERRGKVGEGPDEDQQRAGDIARGGERKGNVQELAQAA